MNFKKIKTDSFVILAKLIAKFPLKILMGFGVFIGFLTWLIPNKRKKIAQRNIQLCFPKLSLEKQKALVKNNLISTGIGFAEMILAYWANESKFIYNFEFSGIKHYKRALEKQKGCILLSCHLHPMELATKAINSKISPPAFILGRQHNNKIFEKYIDDARKTHCEKTIDKKDLRTVLKSLKSNRSIYYIPDQNFSYQCEYIDFFNQPAATVIAPVRLAQSTKTSVVPWFCFRYKNKEGKYCWKVEFLPALDYFHDKDTIQNLTKMNQLFEAQIKMHPEQYLWVHRRFKNHPKGKNYLYKDLN